MSFSVREQDVLQLVLAYLREQGCYETLTALSLETNGSIGKLGKDMLYLQKIVLQGRWSVVEQYITEVKSDLGPDVIIKVSFHVQRQKFLELLSWQGGGEQRMAFPPWHPLSAVDSTTEKSASHHVEMGSVLQQLNILKGLCSTSDFNSLCAFLTVDRLENQPGFEQWTVARGRWETFSAIRGMLAGIFPGDNSPEPSLEGAAGKGLLNTIAMSLAYQVALAPDIPLADSHGEHRAHYSESLGVLVPFLGDGHMPRMFDNAQSGAPTVSLQSPIRPLHAFDEIVPAPHIGYKVHSLVSSAGGSPARGRVSSSALLPSPPRQATTAQHGAAGDYSANTQHAVLEQPAASPSLPAQQPVDFLHRQELLDPRAQYPQVPAEPHPHPHHAHPSESASFLQSSYAGEAPSAVHQQSPAPHYVSPLHGHPPFMPFVHTTVPAQRLSIDTAPQGHSVYNVAEGSSAPNSRSAAPVYPGSLQGGEPQRLWDALPRSASHGPVRSGGGGYPEPDYSQLQAFTPHANAGGDGYYQFDQPLSQAPSYPPQGQQVAYREVHQKPAQPLTYGQVPYQITPAPAPLPLQTQLPTPVSVHSALPSAQADRARVPVAWTVAGEAPQEESKPIPVPTPRLVHAEPSVMAAAFTVGEVDESRVKPMPMALRKKMLADQQAAAAAEEERRRLEQESAAAGERAVSRGRSRSAPRGGGGSGGPTITVAAPGASAGGSRPQSSVRARGVGSQIPLPVNASPAKEAVQEPAVRNNVRNGPPSGAPERPLPAETSLASARAAHERGGSAVRNLSNAAPGSELSVHSDNTRSTRQTKASTSAGGGAEYTPSVLFKTEYPLRCFNVLGVSSAPPAPDAVKVAIGSNAKSIYTFAYARDQLAASRNLGIVDGPGPGVTLLAELKNIHTGSVYCMDWHEGAGLLVSGSNDKAVRLSNPSNGQTSGVLKEHNGTIRTVKFCASSGAPDTASSLLFASAGGGDFKTRLWDAQTAKVLRVLPEHPQSVYGLVWVNSDILVTGCDDGKIIGHDLRSARPAWSYNLNDVLAQTCGETARRGVCSLSLLHPAQAASPNSIPIAAGCIGGYVTLFNAVSGQVLSHQQLHKDDVRSVCVMPATARPNDGSSFELLTSSYDGTVGLWKAGYGSNGSIQYVARRSLQGHGDKVLSATPVAMPGRKTCDIMSSGADGKAILWSLS